MSSDFLAIFSVDLSRIKALMIYDDVDHVIESNASFPSIEFVFRELPKGRCGEFQVFGPAEFLVKIDLINIANKKRRMAKDKLSFLKEMHLDVVKYIAHEMGHWYIYQKGKTKKSSAWKKVPKIILSEFFAQNFGIKARKDPRWAQAVTVGWGKSPL
jgi:hypothetical protein